MRIINRTVNGIALLMGAIAAFGPRSAEVAAQGGLGRWTVPHRYGKLPSNAAAQKRASAKRRNMRARSAK